MISDAIFMYLIFQMILLMLNILAYSKIPVIAIFTIIGTALVAVPTMIALDDYWIIGIILILINMSIPISGLTKTLRS